MLRDKVKTYTPTIDPSYSEDGQELGINLISNVENPAVKIRGVAFNNHDVKDFQFKDEQKLRIAAPVLVPSKIYRNEDDEQFYVDFSKEDIEIIAKDFMSKLTGKGEGVFNLEHTEAMVDSYLLEAILVDSESKVKMIQEDYGIEVPEGTFFIVQQFTDKKIYDDIVRRGATSFSFEGFMGTKLVKEYKFKKTEMVKKLKLSKMENPKKLMGTKRTFKSASKKMKFEKVKEEEELVLVADKFEEGADIVVIEDVAEGANEEFTGEIDSTVEGEDAVIIIDKGSISEIVKEEETKEVEAAEDEEDEKDSKEIKAEEEKGEETIEVEAEDEDKPKEIEAEEEETSAELQEVYKILADIKAELADLKNPTEEVEEEEVDEVTLRNQKYSNALSSFNAFSKKR